jgi:hypothetical protein
VSHRRSLSSAVRHRRHLPFGTQCMSAISTRRFLARPSSLPLSATAVEVGVAPSLFTWSRDLYGV